VGNRGGSRLLSQCCGIKFDRDKEKLNQTLFKNSNQLLPQKEGVSE